ncbi:DNA polymerase zeta catalytic subunit [Cytospora mali]|uniref:DNA polymerase n=1 Tax=Cytospora mali TaxID=578113 RepID=A0A194UZN4_CYTMA|nr:DNA polymerase zeta catalytic subunit [Valsa mali var. pyri (nom. inval.)]
MDVTFSFKVRLNCIDFYQSAPTKYDPQLRNDVRPSQLSKEPKVPVIRVFGSTQTGQKVCAHIHGAFPYLYIEYTGSLAPEEVGAYIYRLHLSIDHALAVSYRQDAYSKHAKYVARVTLTKGVPFYGFHVGYRFFLKIYMFNPVVMTRLADLLQQGVIMKRKFQPYEAHLQYLLQFMCDYNLYGCDYLESSKVFFRSPVPQYDEEDEDLLHVWHGRSISRDNITDDHTLPRSSHCSLEVDICVQDIMNRRVVKERQLHHGFIEKDHPVSASMKLVHSMAGLWRDETKRRKRRMHITNPGSSPFPPEALVSMSADPRESQPQGWIHEEEYMEQIKELIAEEARMTGGPNPSFKDFVQPRPLEDTVNTTLEAVEDLYPHNLLPALGLSSQLANPDQIPTGSVEVDETSILAAQEDDDFYPDDSDDDLFHEATLAREASQRAADAGDEKAKSKMPPPKITINNLSTTVPSAKQSIVGSMPTKSGIAVFQPVKGFPRGVCLSGQGTGRMPVLPITEELLEAADKGGFISKNPIIQAERQGAGLPLKRLDVSVLGSPATKRQKTEGADAPASSGTTMLMTQDSKATTNRPSTNTQRRVRFESSQTARTGMNGMSSKKQENQRLNFHVVKDPNDPSTKLRLSQQTNSQNSEDDTPKTITELDKVSSSAEEVSPVTPSGAKSHALPILVSSNIAPFLNPDRQEPPAAILTEKGSVLNVLDYAPPSAAEVCATMQDNNLPDVIYQDAFYSHEKDVPPRMKEYAGREFRLEGNTLPFLPDFDATGQSPATFGLSVEANSENKKQTEREYHRKSRHCTLRSWEIADLPPTFQEVSDWWAAKQKKSSHRGSPGQEDKSVGLVAMQRPFLSQVIGATPKNRHGFKYSQKRKTTSVQHEAQYMSTMSLEVHVNTRAKLVPNPEEDDIQCIFWATKSDENFQDGSQSSETTLLGIVVVSEDGVLARKIRAQAKVDVIEEPTELDAMVRMVEIVRSHDPDVLTGYEVHGSSWGYLIERARHKYDYNLCDEFSRMKTQSHGRFGKEADRWGFNTTSTIRVTGRHMINIWRSMRGELNLLQYTMENVVWHLLHRRIPHYSWRTLSDWYSNGRPRDLSKVLRYYITRTKMDIRILEENELIPRTSEQARLLGVDFFSVFSRGSQYKVESIMFRIAKPENFVLVSPSRKQVGGQNALECLPLVMEPQSAFYNSPLLVLDFQSLYPSVMIAYNYCYSTFLGRIVNWRGTNKMGFTDYKRQERVLELLQNYINIAPNGMMYTKVEIRKSLLAKMLTEILETRVMVKSGMKQDRDDKTLQQLLKNRQLALKLLANVTYGYTSASFSGRMPCSEIADSIVQTGRETLERAIAYIHSVEKWGAEVVYGDTDSLFIYLKGRTRDQAFDIGQEISKAITDMNPRPIKLKFEKVYHPCVLLAKKRYVGYKYESRDQVKPDFDAKGIETVRRDGTPAEQKMEEKALKLLFETADLSQVKAYFQSQCDKIMRGQVSVQDFCFAKEVRLGTYSGKGPPPPGALISTRRMLEDARAEPQYGERVPYVVITGGPGARLIDRCVAPEDLLDNDHCTLDAEYYITKNLIPPLERIFNLVGANVRQWYDEMPKVQRIRRVDATAATTAAGAAGARKKFTLESYLRSASCVVCGAKMKVNNNSNNNDNIVICGRCKRDAAGSLLQLQTRLNTEERRFREVVKVCQSCAALSPLDEVSCDSKDCPVFYTRKKQEARLRSERGIVEPAVKRLAGLGVGPADLEW